MNLENDLVVQCEVCGHVQLIEKLHWIRLTSIKEEKMGKK